MNQKATILAAFSAVESRERFTPAQLQKLLFLIDKELGEDIGGPFFVFTPHDYGPFDRNVYEMLNTLHQEGLVIIGQSYRIQTYQLTKNGFEFGQRTLKSLDPSISEFIERLAKWIVSLTFPELVSAIYKAYPEMRVNGVFAR